eukprot:TRINITY_DN9710_c0_g1_i1.p1 TRINITY_DN9710_c0_g1~~TRINITY_DN9710_c0_g1_i1.p1  ORF type:complete len:706 (+),score=213.91 TRINITY_DN9710_c0_g1_i1:303-2120(+)
MALSQQTKEEPGEKLEKKEVEKQDEKPVKTEDLKGDREPIQISVSDEKLKSFGRENQAEQVQKSESAVVKAATLLKEMTADELVKTVDHARTELHQRTIEARDDAMEKMKQAKKAQEAAKEAFAAAKAAAELAKHTAEAAGENVGQSELEQLKTGVPGEGVIDMAGWRANQERSTAEVIVWTKAAEPSAVVSWFLEDDLDRPAGEDEGIDSRNIIEGKRRRQSVDYKALEKQIDEEERQRKDVFSDESSEGGAVGSHGKRGAQKEREEAAEAKEVMSAKEWSEHHQRQCAKATELFRQWMFSTATKRHDEILRRKGKLATRLAVGLTGPGRRMLEQELRFYGLKLGFKLQETVVILDAPARTRFQDRHADEWRRAWQQLEEKEKALAAKHEAGSSSGAASQGASGGATGQLASKREVEAPPESKDVAEEAAPNAKRRRLRRVVDDSDEAEAEDAALGDKEAPTHGVQSQSEESPAPGALSHSEAVSAAAVAASDSSALEAEKNMAAAPEATSGGQACSLTTVQEAKARLEASPPPSAEEVSDIVDFLTAASVDATLLAATKIGATVNRVRKAYVGDAALAEKASELVARWRAVWQQFQKEQKQHS